jgi:hypothetical protein
MTLNIISLQLSKKSKPTNANEDEEKVPVRNVNWYSHHGKQLCRELKKTNNTTA